MKKLIIISLTLALSLSLVGGVSAQSRLNQLNRGTTRETMAPGKQNMSDKMASDSAVKELRSNLTNVLLTAINGTTLTVTKDAKTITVTTDATTKFRRHFGGLSTLTEFTVGNTLDVRGIYTDETKTTIAANQIRNRSVMRRRGTFIGDVVSISGSTIVIRSLNRGNQTVTVSATTKYVNRKQQVMTLTDVLVGHRIRVRGMWDKSNNTITQVTNLKDFTLPPKATGSAVPSSSPSAAMTP
jgi:hypothetical protein